MEGIVGGEARGRGTVQEEPMGTKRGGGGAPEVRLSARETRVRPTLRRLRRISLWERVVQAPCARWACAAFRDARRGERPGAGSGPRWGPRGAPVRAGAGTQGRMGPRGRWRVDGDAGRRWFSALCPRFSE